MGIRQAEGSGKEAWRSRQTDRQTVAAAAAVADAANDALALPLPFGVAFLCVVGSLCN